MANEYKLDYTASDINEKLGKIEEKYTAAAKAKVDAIPANPKYTDTVYDDTEIKESVSILGDELVADRGRITAIGLNIETYPTHIAGLPVAVNICCHVNRHIRRVL